MLPVLFRLGPFTLHTYGVLVAAGYLAAVAYLLRHRSRMGLSEDRLWTLVYVLFAGAVLGGKLGYAFASWSQGYGFWTAFIHFRYGFVFYGGVLGSLALGLLYSWRVGLDVPRAADPFGAALPLGHGIGRLGCFAAGCCYGAPTELPWGLRFTHPESLVPPELLGTPLHPAQLYEVAGNLAIFAFIHRRWLGPRSPKRPPGQAFLAYLLLYAGLRFLIELGRADARGAFLAGLSPSQWVALGLAGASAALWGLQRRRRHA